MFLLDDCSLEAVLSDSCNRSCWGGGGGGGEALTTQDQIDLYEGGGGLAGSMHCQEQDNFKLAFAL